MANRRLKIHRPVKANGNSLWVVNISIDGLLSGSSGIGATPALAKKDARKQLKNVGRAR